MVSQHTSRSGSTQMEEGKQEVETSHGPPPDGSLRGWLAVVGGFLTYVATFGLLNSFGIFQTYYQNGMLEGTSASVISWIGSIQLFLVFIGGVVVGPIFDYYGSKALLISGTSIYVLSIMFTSLSTELYQFILAQGIMFGIGDAMLYYPAISAISHWFDRKRGFALGIVVTGCSVGGIVWPFVLQRLLDRVGFAWTVRVSGFICLGLLAPSCFLITPRLPAGKLERKLDGSKKNNPFQIFQDRIFNLFVAAMFFVFWGMFIPYYYLPTYGLAHGMSSYMAQNLLATLNAGSLVGRISSGIFADTLGRFNITFFCALYSGILLMCLHAIKTPAGIIVFSVLYGFFSGGLISLQSACVAQITPDLNQIGLKLGVMSAICSFGVLTGNPIGGALIDSSSGGFGSFIDFSGIILLFGSFLILCSRLAADRNILKIL